MEKGFNRRGGAGRGEEVDEGVDVKLLRKRPINTVTMRKIRLHLH